MCWELSLVPSCGRGTSTQPPLGPAACISPCRPPRPPLPWTLPSRAWKPCICTSCQQSTTPAPGISTGTAQEGPAWWPERGPDGHPLHPEWLGHWPLTNRPLSSRPLALGPALSRLSLVCRRGPPWACHLTHGCTVTRVSLLCLQTTEDARKLIFPNLEQLISQFEKPDQGLVVALQKPIARSGPCLRERRLRLELGADYGNGGVGERPEPGPQNGPPQRLRGRAGLPGARGSRHARRWAAGLLLSHTGLGTDGHRGSPQARELLLLVPQAPPVTFRVALAKHLST